MKITRKYIAIFVLLLSVVAILLVYNLVYKSFNEKTAEIEEQNITYTERRDYLKGLAAQLPRFKSGIASENTKQGVITALFPAAINEENKIMFIDGIEEDPELDIFFSSISYGTPSLISNFVDDFTQTNFVAYEVIMSCSFEGSYEGVNNFIDFVNSRNDRMVVNDISMAFSESTGLLAGTVCITMYYIQGLDCEYQEPITSEIRIGRPNIFGTIN